MVTESIKVSPDTRAIIDKRKKDKKHTSRDSAVRSFIDEAERLKAKEIECKEKDRIIKELKEELKKLKKEKEV
jgi:predicted AlkP superfamily phosphohydrolase/phosphomutase